MESLNFFLNLGISAEQVVDTSTALKSAMMSVFSQGHTDFTLSQALRIIGFNFEQISVIANAGGFCDPSVAFVPVPAPVNDGIILASQQTVDGETGIIVRSRILGLIYQAAEQAGQRSL